VRGRAGAIVGKVTKIEIFPAEKRTVQQKPVAPLAAL
jgi:hypothetical protein